MCWGRGASRLFLPLRPDGPAPCTGSPSGGCSTSSIEETCIAAQTHYTHYATKEFSPLPLAQSHATPRSKACQLLQLLALHLLDKPLSQQLPLACWLLADIAVAPAQMPPAEQLQVPQPRAGRLPAGAAAQGLIPELPPELVPACTSPFAMPANPVQPLVHHSRWHGIPLSQASGVRLQR